MAGPAALAGAVRSRSSVDFSQRPMLVFWETTRACLLACRHCRASATAKAPPGQLTTTEGYALIDQVAGFGRPYPILVLTGGDCLLRPDLFDLVGYAVSRGIPVCLSPSVTPLLDAAMIGRIARSGVRAVSVSLDGARAPTHDGIRGIAGHFLDAGQKIARAYLDIRRCRANGPLPAGPLAPGIHVQRSAAQAGPPGRRPPRVGLTGGWWSYMMVSYLANRAWISGRPGWPCAAASSPAISDRSASCTPAPPMRWSSRLSAG